MNAKEWKRLFDAAVFERKMTGSPESIMQLRNLQKMIFEETMEIVNKGWYIEDLSSRKRHNPDGNLKPFQREFS